MTGYHVPYHLRPNKLVDRRVFMDALSAFERVVPGSRAYASMGGRNLEDHREVHFRLNINALVSIEEDKLTHARQLFNRPIHLIECRHESDADFVVNFDAFQAKFPEHKSIVWLDYTNPKQRYEQLGHVYSLIERMAHGDVLRVTINATPETLGGRKDGEPSTDLRARRMHKLKSQVGDYAPRDPTTNDVTAAGLASFLVGCVERAAVKALAAVDLTPLPLALTRYSDGPHQMVAVTVAVVGSAQSSSVRSALTEILPELPENWNSIALIDVPDLTLRERLRLDACLHTAGDTELIENLGFPLHADHERCASMVSQYRRHYRRLSTFARLDGILG